MHLRTSQFWYLRENCGIRYYEKEKESTNSFGWKRTSKHQKKIPTLRAHHHRVVKGPRPRANIRDALVGGVNAEHSVHGRDIEADKEWKEREYLRTEVFGAEIPFSTVHNWCLYCSVRPWKVMNRKTKCVMSSSGRRYYNSALGHSSIVLGSSRI